MHSLLELLGDFCSSCLSETIWQKVKPVKDPKNIAGLKYRPVCNLSASKEVKPDDSRQPEKKPPAKI